MLDAAGWTSVVLRALDEPMRFGPDPDQATSFIVGPMAWLFAALDDASRERAIANLNAVMTSHAQHDGIWLDSGAWW